MSRVLLQQLEGPGEAFLNVAREGQKLRFSTGGEGDPEGSQRTTSEVQLFANLTPGAPLLPPQASEVLQEEFLGRVNGQQVVYQIVVRRAADLVTPELVEGILSERNGCVGASLCHEIHYFNGFNDTYNVGSRDEWPGGRGSAIKGAGWIPLHEVTKTETQSG